MKLQMEKIIRRGATEKFLRDGASLTCLMMAAAMVLSTGCFAHKEAPERPVAAKGMAEAEAIAAEVEALDLSGSGDKAVPAAVSSMPALRILYLRGGAFEDFSALAGLSALEVLDLGRVKLAAMPAEVLSLSALRDLYLCECGLNEFPQGLDALPHLRYLNLDRNSIAALPEALPPNLRWLRLNHNAIPALPEGIGALASLQRLYLRGNRLEALPESIAKCAALTDLDLSANNLAEFPATLAELPLLRNLDLTGNRRIETLPDDATLAKMSALRTLRLTGCPLTNEERARVRAALHDSCAIIF